MAAFSWDLDESLKTPTKKKTLTPGATTSPLGGYDAVFGGGGGPQVDRPPMGTSMPVDPTPTLGFGEKPEAPPQWGPVTPIPPNQSSPGKPAVPPVGTPRTPIPPNQSWPGQKPDLPPFGTPRTPIPPNQQPGTTIDTDPGLSTEVPTPKPWAGAPMPPNPLPVVPTPPPVVDFPGMSTDPAMPPTTVIPGRTPPKPPGKTEPSFPPQPTPPGQGGPTGPPATTNSGGPQVDSDPGLSTMQGQPGGTAAGAQGGAPIVQQYQDLMGQIQTATDPQQKEVAKDQLARKVFVSMKTAGHDVKWSGDQLMIDGRPYKVGEGTRTTNGAPPPAADAPQVDTPPMFTNSVGDGTGVLPVAPNPNDPSGTGGVAGERPGAGTPGIAPGEGAPNTGPAPTLDQAPGTTNASGTATTNSDPYGRIQGFDYDKITGAKSHDSDQKYSPALRTFSQAIGSGVPITRGNLGGAVDYAKAHGFANAQAVGDDKIDFGDGEGPIDVITSKGEIWFQNGADRFGGGSNPAATTNAAPGIDLNPGMSSDPIAPGAAGVPLGGGPDPFAATGGGTYFPSTGQWIPNSNQAATAAARAAEAAGGGGGASGGAGGWNPTAPTYTPGTMDNSDLEGFGLDELLGRLGHGTTAGPLATDYQARDISNDPQNFGRVEDDYQAGRISNDPLNLGRVDESYQDGRVGDDALSTYSYDGQRDLGPLGAGRTEAETEDLVSRILANPESMDPRTVEMLKAQSKDELAQMQNQEDEDLTAAGYATGNADSNWLQSEKLASAGRRDQSLVASNRAVDMKAAESNAADRKAAAALGQGFAQSKALTARADAAERLAQQQANEGNLQAAAESRAKAQEYHRQAETINEQLRSEAFKTRQSASEANAGRKTTEAGFKRAGEVTNESLRGDAADRRMRGQSTNVGTRQAEAAFGREGELANEANRGAAADRNLKAAQQNIENQFRSTAERQAAFKLAADTSLAAAAQKGDRAAFEEQIKQRATELGQSADKIRQDYVLGLLHEATSKYGIDVGADLDRAKLSQAGQEFQMELAFKLKQLAQQNAQFGASYGLEHARTQAAIDNDQYSRYAETFG